MDTNAILKRADELFDDDRAQEAGAYLEKMAEQAVSEERYGTAMSPRYIRPPGTQPPRSRYTKSASRCSSPKMSATGVWQGYTTTSA